MSPSKAAPTTVAKKPVGPVGYGLLGLTIPWAPTEFDVAVKLLKNALEEGANLWNGGIHYGTAQANSLHLLHHYFSKYPEDSEKVVLSIKGCYDPVSGPVGNREGIRASVEEARNVLDGRKKIDIFELARVDPNTAIETSVEALAELVKEGKVGGIGLSEVSADTIRRAQSIHPIAAVEVELSLFTPDPLHNGIMDTCQELGIPVVAYSPVSRGWLTGKYRSLDDLPVNDFRRKLPRFQPEVFDQNLKLVESVQKIAQRKGLQSSQVAIAWVARQGAIPIPGSTNIERVTLNSHIAELTDEDLTELQSAIKLFPVGGERYGGEHQKLLNA